MRLVYRWRGPLAALLLAVVLLACFAAGSHAANLLPALVPLGWVAMALAAVSGVAAEGDRRVLASPFPSVAFGRAPPVVRF